MKKLSKADRQTRDEVLNNLLSTYAELADKVASINAGILELNELVEKYNEAVQAASDFASDVGSQIEQYISDRSEKWQESDTGQTYIAWMEEWQGFDPSPMEHFPELELEDEFVGDPLLELPEELPE